MFDRDGNTLSISSNRLWIDTAFISAASNANDFAGGAMGPTEIVLSWTGGNLIVIALPDSVNGDSLDAVNSTIEFPGGGFPWPSGVLPTIAVSTNNLSGTYRATLLCRVRPPTEG